MINTLVEFSLFVLNMLSSYYGAKQKSISWIFSILTFPGYIFLMVNNNILSEIILQYIFLILSIIGLCKWKLITIQSNIIHTLKTNDSIGLLIITVGLGIVLGIFTSEGNYSYLSSISASFYLLSTILLISKRLEAWYGFIITNLLYILLFSLTNLWWLVLCHVCYQILAVKGLLKWKKDISMQS